MYCRGLNMFIVNRRVRAINPHTLKVQKNEHFFVSDSDFCNISLCLNIKILEISIFDWTNYGGSSSDYTVTAASRSHLPSTTVTGQQFQSPVNSFSHRSTVSVTGQQFQSPVNSFSHPSTVSVTGQQFQSPVNSFSHRSTVSVTGSTVSVTGQQFQSPVTRSTMDKQKQRPATISNRRDVTNSRCTRNITYKQQQ
jgi:hypothetical protein